jgi:hypothetical protein
MTGRNRFSRVPAVADAATVLLAASARPPPWPGAAQQARPARERPGQEALCHDVQRTTRRLDLAIGIIDAAPGRPRTCCAGHQVAQRTWSRRWC